MKCFTLVLLVLASFSSACGYNSGERKKILSKVLHPFFSSYTEGEFRVIEYCPETPCERILINSSTDEIVAIDFSVLFYLFNTSYPEFRDRNYKMPSGLSPYTELTKLVPDIMDRYVKKEECTSASSPERCVMEYIKNKYKITTDLITEGN